MSETEDRVRSWYRLDSVIPGERVPEWVHVGQRYEGMRGPDAPDEVELFASDGALSAIVPARLLTELPEPPA